MISESYLHRLFFLRKNLSSPNLQKTASLFSKRYPFSNCYRVFIHLYYKNHGFDSKVTIIPYAVVIHRMLSVYRFLSTKLEYQATVVSAEFSVVFHRLRCLVNDFQSAQIACTNSYQSRMSLFRTSLR